MTISKELLDERLCYGSIGRPGTMVKTTSCICSRFAHR